MLSPLERLDTIYCLCLDPYFPRKIYSLCPGWLSVPSSCLSQQRGKNKVSVVGKTTPLNK